MRFSEVLKYAWKVINSTRIKTGITVAIIALGIMALIGIITAITAMKSKFTESFSSMGAGGFTITYRSQSLFGSRPPSTDGKQTRKSSSLKYISYSDAEAFRKLYQFPAITGISVVAARSAIAGFGNKKTNPNVIVFGADENYVPLNGYSLTTGRNFTVQEIMSAAPVCIVGYDIVTALYNGNSNAAIQSRLKINNKTYQVVGVLKSRGATLGFSMDNLVITGYKSARNNFSQATANSWSIGILSRNITQLGPAMAEAGIVFRAIRKLQVTETDNFVLNKNDSLAEKALNTLGFLTISAMVIGIITLMGAAIGLMNIMLVAVSERTREIGLAKAIGATDKNIQNQFLAESVIISLLGAVLGIISGVLVGNVFSLILNTGFVVPWLWVLLGVIICFTVGLAAGLYPALKARSLNPIAALRFE